VVKIFNVDPDFYHRDRREHRGIRKTHDYLCVALSYGLSDAEQVRDFSRIYDINLLRGLKTRDTLTNKKRPHKNLVYGAPCSRKRLFGIYPFFHFGSQGS
jgi:hypothetical protein